MWRPEESMSRNRGARRLWCLPLVTTCLALGALAQAEYPEWVRFVERGSPLREVFFRSVSLPSGPVEARRSPRETRPALDALIASRPSEADLYALRAHEAELGLDFAAAEADWKRHAELAADPVAGQLSLADYYHRRAQPAEEVAALEAAGRTPASAAEQLVAPSEQRSWKAFERSLEVIDAWALPSSVALAQYRAWIERYPQQAVIQQRFFQFLAAENLLTEAERAIADYRAVFPGDQAFPVQAQAELARRRGSGEQALAFYDQAFEPLWPPSLIHEYFSLLDETHQVRRYLDRARAALAANPSDLKSTAWIFHYYQRQGDLAAAQSALFALRQHTESGASTWTAQELFTLARLYESVSNHNEAARYYYALYSLPGAGEDEAERALVGLAGLLLSAPERPIAFGAGDLSFYRDIATVDDHPGFLNGILSLLLNSQSPQYEFSNQEQTAVAYFHRARAAELVRLVDTRFSSSSRREGLHAQLIDAYATYGDSEGVIAAATKYLAEFPDSGLRPQAALRMAEAYAQLGREPEEFAVYDSLLEELARKANGVPIGSAPAAPPEVAQFNSNVFTPGRSAEYVRVLDRYLSRLIALQRERDALALYAREIARNPDDPGLYERLAAFLEQNGLGTQIEQVYRRAIARFQDRSWYHKLARWYLRQKQAAEFGRLTREIVDLFAGTDLDAYFRQVVGFGEIDPRLHLQLNLYAHQRFPHNLTFVRNLLSAYQRPQTRDQGAWERLLHDHWFQDDNLRARFFSFLSMRGGCRASAPRSNLRCRSCATGNGTAWRKRTPLPRSWPRNSIYGAATLKRLRPCCGASPRSFGRMSRWRTARPPCIARSLTLTRS
jgi:cellulose synthase operon protein C